MESVQLLLQHSAGKVFLLFPLNTSLVPIASPLPCCSASQEGRRLDFWLGKKKYKHKISIPFKKKLHQEDTHLHPSDEDVILKLVVVPRVATWKEQDEDRSWSRSLECRLPSGGTQDVPKAKRRS